MQMVSSVTSDCSITKCVGTTYCTRMGISSTIRKDTRPTGRTTPHTLTSLLSPTTAGSQPARLLSFSRNTHWGRNIREGGKQTERDKTEIVMWNNKAQHKLPPYLGTQVHNQIPITFIGRECFSSPWYDFTTGFIQPHPIKKLNRTPILEQTYTKSTSFHTN